MKITRAARTAVGYLAVLSLAACGVTAPDSDGEAVAETEGIPALGIGKVTITDTTQETTVVGFDEDTGEVVARLSLVHGTFALTGPFRSDYDTAEVDGRKLDVDVRGQILSWQTAGYTPTLHMPAHPASRQLLAMFLDAPQVKPILDHWLIGFDGAASDAESPYASGSFSGTNVTPCDGLTSCGSVRGLDINSCGGDGAFITASTATMSNPHNVGTNQRKLAQCCPANSGGSPEPWFAIKTCPEVGTDSECGISSGACKSCATYPAEAAFGCSVTHNASSVSYSFTDTYKLTFTGFTLTNGASGARSDQITGGYPSNVWVIYGSASTNSAYYRADQSHNIFVQAFNSSQEVIIRGACFADSTTYASCNIPATPGDKTFSIEVVKHF